MERATIGHNSAGAGESLEAETKPQANLRACMARIKMAMACRKQASELISDVTKENKAKGIPASILSLGLRWDALTDFERELILNPSAAFTEAKEQMRSLREERREESRAVTEAMKEAKAAGIHDGALRFVLKLEQLDEVEREEFFHSIDAYATYLRLW